MDSITTDRRLTERGVTSVQFLLASGLALILFLALANLVVVQYGRGALRSALDQGARVGAISSSVTRCEDRIEEVLSQLLGGRMGDGVTTSCRVGSTTVVASGTARFQSWTPLAPDFVVDLTALATREVDR
jgi:Flp pilus assembly protein TadG